MFRPQEFTKNSSSKDIFNSQLTTLKGSHDLDTLEEKCQCKRFLN